MSNHRSFRLTPFMLVIWTLTIIGCAFLTIMSIILGSQVIQYGIQMLNDFPAVLCE